MTHWVKAIGTTLDDLSSIAGTTTWRKESWLPVVLWPPHTCHGTDTHRHAINVIFKVYIFKSSTESEWPKSKAGFCLPSSLRDLQHGSKSSTQARLGTRFLRISKKPALATDAPPYIPLFSELFPALCPWFTQKMQVNQTQVHSTVWQKRLALFLSYHSNL